MNKLMNSIKEACSFLDHSLSEDLGARIIFLGVIILVLLIWLLGVMFAKSGFKNERYLTLCKTSMIPANLGFASLFFGFFDEINRFYDLMAVLIILFLFMLFYFLILSIIYLYIKKYSYKAEDFIDQV